jgi:hypothetical protein
MECRTGIHHADHSIVSSLKQLPSSASTAMRVMNACQLTAPLHPARILIVGTGKRNASVLLPEYRQVETEGGRWS